MSIARRPMPAAASSPAKLARQKIGRPRDTAHQVGGLNRRHQALTSFRRSPCSGAYHPTGMIAKSTCKAKSFTNGPLRNPTRALGRWHAEGGRTVRLAQHDRRAPQWREWKTKRRQRLRQGLSGACRGQLHSPSLWDDWLYRSSKDTWLRLSLSMAMVDAVSLPPPSTSPSAAAAFWPPAPGF